MPFQARFFKFHLSKFFKCLTVLTQADKLLVESRLKNVVVMPNPLETVPVSNIPSKKNVILAVGRVDNWYIKGFDNLIRAWGKLNESSKVPDSCSKFNSDNIAFKIEREGWKLVIAGVWRSSETREYLDGIAKECGVKDRIEYTGFVRDMQSLYQESSIFVLSSRHEGFGLVLIEAMSQGCACIACDYKGRQREIMNPAPHQTLPRREGEKTIENQNLGTKNLKPETRNLPVEACETGILCEPDSVDALANALEKMIEDDRYRESIRKNAVERSKCYSIGIIVDIWEDLLVRVVNNDRIIKN